MHGVSIKTVKFRYENFNVKWDMKVTLYKIGLLKAKYKL
jgi:hypothetical protein